MVGITAKYSSSVEIIAFQMIGDIPLKETRVEGILPTYPTIADIEFGITSMFGICLSR
jgi:hypothetical protein